MEAVFICRLDKYGTWEILVDSLNISIVSIVDSTFTRIHYARNNHVLGAVASKTM